MNRHYALYIVAVALFALDRITKYWAVQKLQVGPYYVNQFLSFELSYNRGISWSIFYSENSVIFGILTLAIAGIISGLMYYTFYRAYRGYSIVGCTITVVGAFSNFVDRFYYQGVVDFIVLSYGAWSWPVFNIADICIVIGVLYMALYEL